MEQEPFKAPPIRIGDKVLQAVLKDPVEDGWELREVKPEPPEDMEIFWGPFCPD